VYRSGNLHNHFRRTKHYASSLCSFHGFSLKKERDSLVPRAISSVLAKRKARSKNLGNSVELLNQDNTEPSRRGNFAEGVTTMAEISLEIEAGQVAARQRVAPSALLRVKI
jgi:hypothetical protein